jgi:hypothetical protein
LWVAKAFEDLVGFELCVFDTCFGRLVDVGGEGDGRVTGHVLAKALDGPYFFCRRETRGHRVVGK